MKKLIVTIEVIYVKKNSTFACAGRRTQILCKNVFKVSKECLLHI